MKTDTIFVTLLLRYLLSFGVGFVSCACNFAPPVTFKSVTGYLASFHFDCCTVQCPLRFLGCYSKFTQAFDLLKII